MISPEVAKASAMFVVWGLSFLAISATLRRWMGFPKASIPSAIISFLIVLSFYHFSIYEYVRDVTYIYNYELKPAELSIFSAIAFVILVIPFAYLLSLRLRREYYRSLFHSIVGVFFALLLYANQTACILAFSIAFCGLLVYFSMFGDESRFCVFFRNLVERSFRQGSADYIAIFLFLLGSFMVVIFMPKNVALGSILILSLGDPSAGIVGRFAGKNRWPHNPEKSVEGSLAMFSICTLTLIAIGFSPMISVVVSACATVFESLSLKIGDNLIIPIVSGMILESL